MQRCARGFLISLSLLLAVGCAAARGPSGASSATWESADLLTQEQIHNYGDAYNAVEALRTRWLSARGPDSFQSPSEVLVYRDDVQVGGVEALRGMSTKEIAYIRYFDGVSAAARWGLGHGAGVIYVSTSLDP